MGKDDKIILSKEHGLQPTIPVCFICGKDRNEVALLGAQGDKLARAMGSHDGAMPMRCVIDHVPCDECQEHMKQGIFLVETDRNTSLGTGSYWLVKEEAVERMMSPESFEKARKSRVVLIDKKTAGDIGLHDVKTTEETSDVES